jgi:hypothetical protein
MVVKPGLKGVTTPVLALIVATDVLEEVHTVVLVEGGVVAVKVGVDAIPHTVKVPLMVGNSLTVTVINALGLSQVDTVWLT